MYILLLSIYITAKYWLYSPSCTNNILEPIYLTRKSLYPPLPHPDVAPPRSPLAASALFSTSVVGCFFVMFTSWLYFLDSTYKQCYSVSFSGWRALRILPSESFMLLHMAEIPFSVAAQSPQCTYCAISSLSVHCWRTAAMGFLEAYFSFLLLSFGGLSSAFGSFS